MTQGAAWEQQQAVERIARLTKQATDAAVELQAAMGDLVTAVASAASAQSAKAVVVFVERLEMVEQRVTQIREDIADIKTLLRDIDERLQGHAL